MTAPSYSAVILGGGRSPWLQPLAGTQVLCLARLQGRRLLDWQLAALRSSGRVGRIVVALDQAALGQAEPLPEGVTAIAAGRSLPDTCLKAAAYLAEPASKLLFLCQDIPLVTPAAIQDFLAQCEARPEGELYYPIIPKEACLAAYPGTQRTFIRIKEGSFTGGNMMLVAASVIPRGQAKAEELFALRKKPWQFCRWLGWDFIFKLFFHRLAAAEAEVRMTRLMAMESKLIFCPYPEVGVDVDKAADWALLTELSAPGPAPQ